MSTKTQAPKTKTIKPKTPKTIKVESTVSVIENTNTTFDLENFDCSQILVKSSTLAATFDKLSNYKNDKLVKSFIKDVASFESKIRKIHVRATTIDCKITRQVKKFEKLDARCNNVVNDFCKLLSDYHLALCLTNKGIKDGLVQAKTNVARLESQTQYFMCQYQKDLLTIDVDCK